MVFNGPNHTPHMHQLEQHAETLVSFLSQQRLFLGSNQMWAVSGSQLSVKTSIAGTQTHYVWTVSILRYAVGV
jgi:hypothetical protein